MDLGAQPLFNCHLRRPYGVSPSLKYNHWLTRESTRIIETRVVIGHGPETMAADDAVELVHSFW